MNTIGKYQLTILIPVYNEEDNICLLETKLSAFLQKSLYSACVLFIDDGSTDSSKRQIKEICMRNSGFFYIALCKNKGLSSALKAGIDIVQSPYVGYIDADLQTNPDDFNLLLKEVHDYELVMGTRVNRQDSFSKKVQGIIANGFRRLITKDGVWDTGCPLKVLHTDYAKRIPFFAGMHRFLPALIQLQKGRVCQIPVPHYPRTRGTSKFHLRNRLFSSFFDCWALYWMRKRYINYSIKESNLSSNK